MRGPGRRLPIDAIAVERAIAGRPVELILSEREEVVRILTLRGWSAALIAQHAGISQRTVNRMRARLGVPGRTPTRTLRHVA